jgi:23S rRNA (uracil1939-C5)-methyltransferase
MTLEQVRNEAQNIFADDVEAAAGDHGVSVSPEIGTLKTREVTRSVGVDRYRFDATSFFQINHTMLGPLVLAAIGDASGRNAVDLYSGVGLFTLPLARRFSQVVAVEGNSRACRYAIQNINDAGLTNVEVINRRVDDWLRDSTISDPIDLILLDPPRSGAEPEVIEGLLIARPTQIVYVSCDPSTLARDLKALLAGDYRLDSLAAFDMFPQTHHVETVVHLKRDG